jgi:hypothetical protein
VSVLKNEREKSEGSFGTGPVSGMPNEGEKAAAGSWTRCVSCAVVRL